MVNEGNGLAFPTFPTQFSEEEQKRLTEIEEQKKKMLEVYQTKFAPAAWAEVSLPEKGLRNLLPSWLSGVVGAATPWEWGWDFGFTPEQAQDELFKLEEEFKELTRQKKVTRLLADIQTDLMVAALSGSPITDISQLLSNFPELRTDFTEDELSYITALAQNLLHATPEQILSGKIFAYDPARIPLTAEDIDKFAKESPEIAPRFILSTVAFSKDLNEIGTALQQAYPPRVEVSAEATEGLRQKLLDYFRQRNIDLGITLGEDTPIGEIIKAAHEKIAEDEGELLYLTNEDTGELVVAHLRSDSSVWIELPPEKPGASPAYELLGYYDKDADRVVAYDGMGEPMVTEQKEEFWLKDLWDAFYLGVSQAWHATEQAILYTIPDALLSFIQDKVVDSKASKRVIDDWKSNLQHDYEVRQADFQSWLVEHPELIPRPEYTQNPLEHTELFKDPYYYLYTIAANAPLLGAALVVGIGTTVITKNPWIGASAGAAVLTPVQIHSVYEDLVANGADPDKASTMATSVGTLMGLVEIIPGMIALRVIAPTFMRIFRGNLQRQLTKGLVTSLSVKGILKTAGIIEVAEVLEEIIQGAMQNAAVQTVDENRGILDNLPQTAITTAIAVAPLALFGGFSSYLNMKANLPPAIIEEIDAAAKKMEDAGLTPEHAEAVAYSQTIETDTGMAAVKVASDKIADEIPSKDAIPPKIKVEQDLLQSVNTEIEVFTVSLDMQKDILVKLRASGTPGDVLVQAKVAEQIKTIEAVENTLQDLETQRGKLVKRIQKLKKKYQITPESTEIADIISRITVPAVLPNAQLINLIVAKFDPKFAEDTDSYIGKGGTGAVIGDRYNKFKTYLETDKSIEAPEIRVTDNGSVTFMNGRNRYAVLRDMGIKNIPVVMNSESLVNARKFGYIQEKVLPPTEDIAPSAKGTPIEPVDTRPTTVDGLPKIKDWDDEQIDVRKALNDNPDIAKNIKVSKKIKEFRKQAEESWTKADEEARKDIVKSAKLPKETIAKDWKDLTPPEQQALTLNAIEDGSINFPAKRELFDMIYYMQFLEEETGQPWLAIFWRTLIGYGAAKKAKLDFLKRIGEDPNFTHIRTNKEALDRVTQEVNARNPALHIDHPEGLTDQELLLANVIEGIYRSYEGKVRYLRVMHLESNIETFKKEFKEAPEPELIMALELKRQGDKEGLWSFLQDVSWGTVVGYDPWIASYPQLEAHRTMLGTTRGAARLLRRDSVEMPHMEMNVLLRLSTYIAQIEAQWRLEPELDIIEEFWSRSGRKFSNMGHMERILRGWTKELQGIPVEQTIADRILRRVWRQAMSAIFMHPWMAFRNTHQALAFHPDRSELARIHTDPTPPHLKELGRIYYDVFASQLRGIRMDWLYTGDRGIPGLGWLTRLADKVSMYPHSDNIPRRWTFEASLNKARRATEQYQKDKDVNKWLKASGANHLRQTERNYVLQLLAQERFDLAVPGLRNISGENMANLFIAHRMADMTHFIYERTFRSPIEMGGTGRILYNLIVFPRGYFQRLYFQWDKIFNKETDWTQARAGFRDLIMILVVGMMISEWIRKITGRPRRSYNPMDIIQWQLGGLVVGVGMDTTALVGDLIQALDPTADPEFKEQVLNRLPGELIRQADVFIPFYRNLMDSLEAITGTKNIDVHFLRQMRSILDEAYTLEEIETIERKLWEKIRKAVLAGEPPDPTKFQQIQLGLQEAQLRLGEMDAEGRFYTLRQFAGDVRNLTTPIPDDMLVEDYGFSDLVIFYKESQDIWSEMYALSTSPASIRKKWRESHVEAEAMLLFWGMYSTSVFTRGSSEWKEVTNLLQTWFDYYEIDQRMHSYFADWTIPMW